MTTSIMSLKFEKEYMDEIKKSRAEDEEKIRKNNGNMMMDRN